jgi:sugar lactone lactonase YvrE
VGLGQRREGESGICGRPVIRRDEVEIVVQGLKFAESPRWHDGSLWFVDMIDHTVLRLDTDRQCHQVAAFDDETSGLGFLPDGSALVVLRGRKTLMAIDPISGASRLYADLSDLPCESLNDMILDDDGRAYVGCVIRRGDDEDVDVGEFIAVVDDGGRVQQINSGLVNPNGIALSESGDVLVVAETWGHRLTEYRVQADGTLGGRRCRASLPDAAPDGICLDSDDGVWLATLLNGEVLRVDAGGVITDRVVTGHPWAMAAVLGDDDRRTLFMCVANTSFRTLRVPGGTASSIVASRVQVPGAGRP